MKYSLAVPFLERIVSLAVEGGFTGQITANSFMKREFGKKLIEEFFPRVDLTHVIDTSGAYIPGARHPDGHSVRAEPEAGGEHAADGDGNPRRADDARRPGEGIGLVGDRRRRSTSRDRQSEFTSASATRRARLFTDILGRIGGGGAAELKERLDRVSRSSHSDDCRLRSVSPVVTGDDDAFASTQPQCDDEAMPRTSFVKGFVIGDNIRDW